MCSPLEAFTIFRKPSYRGVTMSSLHCRPEDGVKEEQDAPCQLDQPAQASQSQVNHHGTVSTFKHKQNTRKSHLTNSFSTLKYTEGIHSITQHFPEKKISICFKKETHRLLQHQAKKKPSVCYNIKLVLKKMPNSEGVQCYRGSLIHKANVKAPRAAAPRGTIIDRKGLKVNEKSKRYIFWT